MSPTAIKDLGELGDLLAGEREASVPPRATSSMMWTHEPTLMRCRSAITSLDGGEAMDCHIDWSTSKVEHGKLRVELKPAPDFAFMMEFDGIVDPLQHHRHEGWGAVLLAHGHVVVSDVRVEFAPELRAFLDETVREANRLVVDTRAREQQREEAEAARAAEQEAKQSAAAEAAAERDAQLTDTFRQAG